MAHIAKEALKSNTYEIRTKFGYTQKEFGNILGVSERMIQNYEATQTTLPLDRALRICEKLKCSLDQIYLNSSLKPYPDKFSVDIRDFLSKDKDSLVFSIPDSYWTYLNEIDRINKLEITETAKNRLLADLDNSYDNSKSTVVWECRIPFDSFLSFLIFGDTTIPYVNMDNTETGQQKPTKKQLKEAANFISQVVSP